MSTGVPTIQSTTGTATATPTEQMELVEVPPMIDFGPEDAADLMWKQVHRIVQSSLGGRGLRRIEPQHEGLVTVAPGIAVSAVEYQDRFGDVDLELYRSRMSPEAFKVFVRYMGLIPGDPNLDVTQIASMPE